MTGLDALAADDDQHCHAITRLLLAPEDPEVRRPTPQGRCRLRSEGATPSTPRLLLNLTARGQHGLWSVRLAGWATPSTFVRNPSTPEAVTLALDATDSPPPAPGTAFQVLAASKSSANTERVAELDPATAPCSSVVTVLELPGHVPAEPTKNET